MIQTIPNTTSARWGAVSILRGGLAPEFSPRPEHSSPRSNFSPTRYGPTPVSGPQRPVRGGYHRGGGTTQPDMQAR